MIYTLTLLGIYILSVLVIYGVSRFRPHTLWRLHPIPIVALFSFVPAVALGREILLRMELWEVVSTVPIWLSAGLTVLLVVGIIPARRWIRKDVLDRTKDSARQFLDSLPERMMSVEAAECRREISMEEATERKTQVQRAADRVATIHGVGRFLNLLLKLHLVRMGLQILGAIAIDAWSEGAAGWQTLNACSTVVIIDGALILGPFLLLMGSLVLLRPNSEPRHQLSG